MVETSLGETEVVICVDGVGDPITIVAMGNSGEASYAYVVTDDAGMVLAYPPSNVIDLDGAGVGICRIYGVSFSGTLDTTTGIPVGSVSASGCSDVSANSVRVIREAADGGNIMSMDGFTSISICVDASPDPIDLAHVTAASNLSFAYVITDNSDMVLAFPPGSPIDLNGAGVGICRVWGVSYAGTLNTTTGIHISQVTSTSCLDLSAGFLQVVRVDTGAPCDLTVAVQSVAPVDSATVSMEFATTYGNSYGLEGTSDLISGIWTSVVAGVAGNGETISVPYPIEPGAAQGAIRVVVE